VPPFKQKDHLMKAFLQDYRLLMIAKNKKSKLNDEFGYTNYCGIFFT